MTWRSTPNLLTDPARVCQMRGHHLWKPTPSSDTATCTQCDAEHLHDPQADGNRWICGCGMERRRRTTLYSDERVSS